VRATIHPKSSGAEVVSISPDDGSVVVNVGGPTQLTIDFDGGLDEVDTAGPFYTGSPMHTFCWFVDPLEPSQLPDPPDSSTVVVRPGEPLPNITSLDPGRQQTVVFAPGVHRSPTDFPHGFTVLQFATEHALLPLCRLGATRRPGVCPIFQNITVTVDGTGVLSGEEMTRAGGHNSNVSPFGIMMGKVHNVSLRGLTLVDMPNHHVIAGTGPCRHAPT
jgi:hypothetical protein